MRRNWGSIDCGGNLVISLLEPDYRLLGSFAVCGLAKKKGNLEVESSDQ